MQTKEILANTNKIYKQFEIPKNLQEHMYQVTAVAQLILKNWKGEFKGKDQLLASCLLHDLGNIIKIVKSEGSTKNESIEIKKLKQKRKEILKKWGASHQDATIKMAKKIKVPNTLLQILKQRDLRNIKSVLKLKNDAVKISLYADMRVSPKGIVSIKERMSEAKKRYPNLNDWDDLHKDLVKLEKQLFKKVKIPPNKITNSTIKPFLKSWLE